MAHTDRECTALQPVARSARSRGRWKPLARAADCPLFANRCHRRGRGELQGSVPRPELGRRRVQEDRETLRSCDRQSSRQHVSARRRPFGAFMLLRRMAGTMGPTTRTLLGGGAGFLLGGGVGEALMGALLGRQMAASGAAAAAAAGAAGAAAARSWVGRFVGIAGSLLRSGLGMILISAGIYAITQIVENWETVKTRLLAIWEELRQAAPTWMGGQGRGWETFGARGGAVEQAERSLQDWARGTSFGQWLIENGYAMTDSQMAPSGRVRTIARWAWIWICSSPTLNIAPAYLVQRAPPAPRSLQARSTSR